MPLGAARHGMNAPDRIIPIAQEGAACHSGKEQMRAAAAAAGKSDTLQQYARDYPVEAKGPHDQPQSMCPAFGSLRVGLRMRRTMTILSGSACCVYGLTFTSHFYGARRSVGYVPFNSETLVTGKLFEDIREAVYAQADSQNYDAIVIINLCVPTASGVPLQLLPKEINGVRKTCSPARCCATRAPRPKPALLPRRRTASPTSRPSRCWARCFRPIRLASA
jgi:3,8-divinyl chlorophyllide a/chlorophyllide a reductase subunit Y